MLSRHRGAPLRLAKSSSNVHPDAVWGSGFRLQGFMVDKLISPKPYGKVAATCRKQRLGRQRKRLSRHGVKEELYTTLCLGVLF